ncbi:hypothetical protein [Mycolicibacterium goodii]|nr:hypothetical protein [Mycolicibacterium goodii]MBU8841233.1 hypothetical protein [Mycolicibacterium goodii]
MTEMREQDWRTGWRGTLLNHPADAAEVAIVQFDHLPYPTWAEWADLAY